MHENVQDCIFEAKKMEKPLVNQAYLLQKYPGKGGWTYAEIPGISQDKSAPFGWVRVRGSIDGYPIKQYRLMPMGNGKLFLPVKAEIRKIIGKKEGDYVAVVLYKDESPLEIPEALQLCLLDEPAAYSAFMALSESAQKKHIDWIFSVKKIETQAERIAECIQMLLEHK